MEKKHCGSLAKACNRLRRYQDARPNRKPYTQKQVREFLELVDEVLAVAPPLPKAKKLGRAARTFKKKFEDARPKDEYLLRGLRSVTAASWRAAHEMAQLTFEIHLYLAAVCECPKKYEPYV
jgi:hypothetical protein